jgi:hypothetical protein
MFFWEIIVLFRRTLLIVLDVGLYRNPSWKFASFVFLSLTLFLIHALAKPFATNLQNQMETVSLFLLVLISILLTADSVPFSDGTQAMLSVLILVPSLSFLIYFAVTKVQVLRARLAVFKVTNIPLVGTRLSKLSIFNREDNAKAPPVIIDPTTGEARPAPTMRKLPTSASLLENTEPAVPLSPVSSVPSPLATTTGGKDHSAVPIVVEAAKRSDDVKRNDRTGSITIAPPPATQPRRISTTNQPMEIELQSRSAAPQPVTPIVANTPTPIPTPTPAAPSVVATTAPVVPSPTKALASVEPQQSPVVTIPDPVEAPESLPVMFDLPTPLTTTATVPPSKPIVQAAPVVTPAPAKSSAAKVASRGRGPSKASTPVVQPAVTPVTVASTAAISTNETKAPPTVAPVATPSLASAVATLMSFAPAPSSSVAPAKSTVKAATPFDDAIPPPPPAPSDDDDSDTDIPGPPPDTQSN